MAPAAFRASRTPNAAYVVEAPTQTPRALGVAQITSLAAVVFGCFSRAIAAHFRNDTVSSLMTPLSVAGLIAFGIVMLEVWRNTPTALLAGTSVFPQLLALGLFGGAVSATRKNRLSLAFSKDAPERLNVTGPYSRTRHPFYTSYTLFWWGCAAASASPFAALAASGMTIAYVAAAFFEERKFDRSALKHEYEAYRAMAGFFWPRMRRVSR